MTISEWPLEERPREKLLDKGAEALSDAELLAIFLRTGCKGMKPIQIIKKPQLRPPPQKTGHTEQTIGFQPEIIGGKIINRRVDQ